MTKAAELDINIQHEIERGELSFQQIARSFNVSYDVVMIIAEQLQEQYMFEVQ